MLHEQTVVGVGIVVVPFIFEQDANTGNNKSLLRTFCQAKAPKMKMKSKFVILKQPSYIITDDNMQKTCARVVSHPICLESLLAFAFAYSPYRSTCVCFFSHFLSLSPSHTLSVSMLFRFMLCLFQYALYFKPTIVRFAIFEHTNEIHLCFWFRHTVKSHK